MMTARTPINADSSPFSSEGEEMRDTSPERESRSPVNTRSKSSTTTPMGRGRGQMLRMRSGESTPRPSGRGAGFPAATAAPGSSTMGGEMIPPPTLLPGSVGGEAQPDHRDERDGAMAAAVTFAGTQEQIKEAGYAGIARGKQLQRTPQEVAEKETLFWKEQHRVQDLRKEALHTPQKDPPAETLQAPFLGPRDKGEARARNEIPAHEIQGLQHPTLSGSRVGSTGLPEETFASTLPENTPEGVSIGEYKKTLEERERLLFRNKLHEQREQAALAEADEAAEKARAAQQAVQVRTDQAAFVAFCIRAKAAGLDPPIRATGPEDGMDVDQRGGESRPQEEEEDAAEVQFREQRSQELFNIDLGLKQLEWKKADAERERQRAEITAKAAMRQLEQEESRAEKRRREVERPPPMVTFASDSGMAPIGSELTSALPPFTSQELQGMRIAARMVTQKFVDEGRLLTPEEGKRAVLGRGQGASSLPAEQGDSWWPVPTPTPRSESARTPESPALRSAPPFSSGEPGQWATWKANFVRIARGCQWEDQRVRHEMARAITGKAATMVSDIDPDPPILSLTASELMGMYDSRFAATLDPDETAIAISLFETSRQMSQETHAQWHARLLALFRVAYPTLDHQAELSLINRFAMGLSETDLRLSVTRGQPNPTYAQALARVNDEVCRLRDLADRAAIDNMPMSRLDRRVTDTLSNYELGGVTAIEPARQAGISAAARGGLHRSHPVYWSDPPDRRLGCHFCKRSGHSRGVCSEWQHAITLFKQEDRQFWPPTGPSEYRVQLPNIPGAPVYSMQQALQIMERCRSEYMTDMQALQVLQQIGLRPWLVENHSGR
jgi:hypothetical protein